MAFRRGRTCAATEQHEFHRQSADLRGPTRSPCVIECAGARISTVARIVNRDGPRARARGRILHRELKPSNTRLSPRRVVKAIRGVAHFGGREELLGTLLATYGIAKS